MKREELIAMGISEENVEKIIADYGSAVQREQAKAAELKAKADSWFAHIAVEVPGEAASNEWLEAVDDEAYAKL